MESIQTLLFEQYRKASRQWSLHCRTNSYPDEWPVERICLYQFGVVLGKYLECDPETLRMIEKMSCPEEEECIKQEIRLSLQRELRNLEGLPELDCIQVDKLKLTQEKLNALQAKTIQQWAKDYGCMAIFHVDQKDIPGFLYLKYAYENYQYQVEAPWNGNQPEVEDLYRGDFDKTSQFWKYGLLPVDGTREILDLNPPRLYAKGKNRTLFLKNIPMEMAGHFRKLLENGQIQDLALRASGEIYPGSFKQELIMEEVERGRIFSLTDLSCDITRLYSQNYEDALWVTIDEENITFEELCDNFQTSGDNIVTQVMHLQYCKEPNGVYITHLDQEYIFYTEDEFDVRRRDPNQKGKTRSRVKSFKIDNSRIPFDLVYTVQWKDSAGNLLPPVQVPFLCYVLDCYFQHKDLLGEYFQNLSQPV